MPSPFYANGHTLGSGTQDDRTFSLLRKTLGSFLETGSDEDFQADDWRY